jgi:nucleotide-binding universal stress UspA family protein
LEIVMAFKTILVPTEQHAFMNSTLETALLLARAFEGYVEGFALRADVAAAFAIGEVGAIALAGALEQEVLANEQQSRSLFESFMQERGVPFGGSTKGLSSSWLPDAPEGDRFVGSHGRVFDIIVVGRPGRDPKGPRINTLEAALFESGRPILIAPPSPRAEVGRNVLIAWNCSTEQARATAFAMPLLKRASRVVVLTVEGGAAVPGPSGQQLCRYLELHGVPVEPLTVGLEGRSTGEAVLFHAKALGCDLLVKGAYTQSRLRQMIFGGTTRHVLGHAVIPVLMAH